MLFTRFPTTNKLIDEQIVEVTDIVRKVVFSDAAINLSDVYTEYKLRDGDTLESIAKRVYGREELSWVLMVYNRYIDPFYSPALSTIALDKYINAKYQGQTLFLSPVGSSLPFSATDAGITIGSLLLKKVNNSGGVTGFTEYKGEPRGTIKSYDPRTGSILLTKQTSKFKANDLVAILQDRVEVVEATVTKVVDSSREAPFGFGQSITGASSDLDPLATIPDSNGVQTSIGMTNDTYATAVTYGSTILYNYIYNNTQTYVTTNAVYENDLNERKSRIKILDPSLIPSIELQMSELFRNA
jgi:hypothetical protein|tara:strand:+ start:111 stop:1007 length:897 start_codon:yes stop_codon:yes gene_type:complete